MSISLALSIFVLFSIIIFFLLFGAAAVSVYGISEVSLTSIYASLKSHKLEVLF